MGALTHWVCFLFFLKEQLMFWPLILVYSFGGLFIWVVSWLAGDSANVTPIPKGPPSSSVANYQLISITSVLSKVFECLVSVRLGRFMEHSVVLQLPSLLIWVPVMHFCVCHIHCKVHWRVGSRLGLYRLISAQPLIRSTIGEFCISSVLWVLEVLCCLYNTVPIKLITAPYGGWL